MSQYCSLHRPPQQVKPHVQAFPLLASPMPPVQAEPQAKPSYQVKPPPPLSPYFQAESQAELQAQKRQVECQAVQLAPAPVQEEP